MNIDDSLGDAQHELGMREGFDVGLEMSGSSAALRDMIAQMTHGGRIAVLGIPRLEIGVDFAAVVLKMLTIKASMAVRCLRPGTRCRCSWRADSTFGVITDRFHYTEYERPSRQRVPVVVAR